MQESKMFALNLRRRDRSKIILLLAFIVCLLLVYYFKVIAKSGVTSRKTVDDYDFIKHGIVPKKTIPLVFVDEHHEVVPYWFREIINGNLPKQGNTIIHVDGHSDLATPTDLEDIINVQVKKHMSLMDMHPMMLRNDVFITPFLLKGMYDSILWVYPKFMEPIDASFYNEAKAYGFRKGYTTGCLCKTRTPTAGTSCLLIEETSWDSAKTYIPGDQCRIITPLRLKMINEENLGTFLSSNWIKNSQNIVLDIDEDYFGVATDYARALSEISSSDIRGINREMNTLYCPSSAEEEVILDTILRDIISNIIKAKSSIEQTKLDLVHDKRLKSGLKCKLSKKEVENIVEFLSTLWHSFGVSQLQMLRRLHFCLGSTPLLGEGKFGACWGMDPWSQTTHQSSVNTDNILQRTKKVKKLFNAIFQASPGPQIITVARSIRDSYASRPMFQEVEHSLLMALKETAFAQKVSLNEEYDINLLFGKRGWVDG